MLTIYESFLYKKKQKLSSINFLTNFRFNLISLIFILFFLCDGYKKKRKKNLYFCNQIERQNLSQIFQKEQTKKKYEAFVLSSKTINQRQMNFLFFKRDTTFKQHPLLQQYSKKKKENSSSNFRLFYFLENKIFSVIYSYFLFFNKNKKNKKKNS